MKAGNILKLAAPLYLSDHAEHLRGGLRETLDIILAAADKFNADLAVTHADGNLSPQGRVAASVKVAAAALAKLSAVETTTIKGLTDHAASIERSLLGKRSFNAPTDPAERIAHELHLQEIRNQLRQLPLAEREIVYRTSNDPLVLRAIDTAPMTLSETRPDGSRRMEPFIDPAVQTEANLDRAERGDPSTVARLREVQSLRQVCRLAVNGVRREILDEVPDAGSQLVAV